MEKLTKGEVKKVAELSRLNIEEKELEYYAEELSSVLEYARQLDELDTSSVEPMTQAVNLQTVLRDDIQEESNTNIRARAVEVLMRAVPFKHNGFAKVKSVFKDRN
ncbi:MAG: Asp-tRNA(Asn)/Glu-tRNA(Gln) amidotransferase subunit GatC [Candidatus Spechtbacterales bacterium]